MQSGEEVRFNIINKELISIMKNRGRWITMERRMPMDTWVFILLFYLGLYLKCFVMTRFEESKKRRSS